MKKIIFILVTFISILISCDDYVDVNTDPNRLFANQIGPNKLLPAAQVGAYATQATIMNTLGNVFMNSWAPNVQSFTGGYTRETQLIIDNTFYQAIFNNIYLNVSNLQTIIDLPNADHKNDNFVIAAKVLKAYYMQFIVDLYGDAPYTETFKKLANPTPKYNDDQFIYRQLLKELDEARTLIAAQNGDATDIASFDVMFKGNMSTWEKFANTVELKYLVRMSKSTGAVATYRDARIAALPQNFILTFVSINPGYEYGTTTQLNPFFSTYAGDNAGNTVQNWAFIAPSGHFYKALNKYSRYPSTNNSTQIISSSAIDYPNLDDPRRGRLFRRGAGQGYVRAVTQGQTAVDMFDTSLGQVKGIAARQGIGVFNPYNQNPDIVGGQDVLDYSGKVDGYLMTTSEIEFLLAEAAHIGYVGFTDAQLHFDAGINASMAYLGASAGTYIDDINLKPNFGYAVGNYDEKYHAIMYQKWVGLMSINGIESFIDYNRTGYPLTPLAIGASQPRKPKRLIYPSQEYTANSNNVPNITPVEIFATSHPSHPFWMLGNPVLGN